MEDGIIVPKKFVYRTIFDLGHDVYDNEPGEVITCDIGYVPMKRRIQRLLETGEAIQSWYKGEYEYGENQEMDDDMYPNPTLDHDFDAADASQALQALASKQKRTTRRANEKASEEKAESENKVTVPSVDSTTPPDDGK